MPMKCMDQMPAPIENAPPTSHSAAVRPEVFVTLPARSSAVYEAIMATRMDRATSVEL